MFIPPPPPHTHTLSSLFLNDIEEQFLLSGFDGIDLNMFKMFMLLYADDIEEQFLLSGFDGIDLNMFKMFMLLYADDIVFFSNTAEELQYGLNLLSEYCAK